MTASKVYQKLKKNKPFFFYSNKTILLSYTLNFLFFMATTQKTQQEMLVEIYTDTKKIKRYFQLTIWITVGTLVLPFVILAIALPFILNMLESINPLSALGL